ncbi:phosphoribosylformylglycinamidine synthase subunit PurS [Helicobacter saguini]|uniref:Phosphoribosylformylglycinamidine synthase subunit PurS n=1 Tax=Helicobacter saguini TaxID=1548018 RepID=A0A347VKL9_9HELI|nr:phosphoribosylformylglycinamidine synthase subunit PurS [Helicobacter saguini]MWV61196.1 phosphoribosylformylglycinamidine synthase subunit PurS [Helicobacter saguini]MWV68137.1 phosphoribosylformylglycinamidine synthase subunit PurS [Helicobacter saguini]MWV70400.1 phosphoribosylformylglycinamidine synthase subunit PurS [Helicobacter saguini]MWV72301.1 phosphoribosylformylglycinamidine synthase subunit PurS [Helicobacter saguini]TLD95340.1 phosphoribosylformylglycinamidine synthase, purS p
MLFKAQIEISTRKDVLNPEAKAILQALQSLQFSVNDLQLNKKIYISIESKSKNDAFKKLDSMCKELLANPIIEDYIISIEDSKKSAKVIESNMESNIESSAKTRAKPKKKTPKKRGRAHKYDEFLDSISDKLKALKYQNDIGFPTLAKAINTAYGIKISVQTLYDYFVRKLEWKKGK